MRKSDADLLILGIDMPGRGGIDVVRELRRLKNEIRILVLSRHAADVYAVRAIEAGAEGYLEKNTSRGTLITAIRQVVIDGKFITGQVGAVLASHVRERGNNKRGNDEHALLSDREFQVLASIGNGRTATEIAHELALSVKTISTYRARLLDKMGLENNAQLMHYAIENKIV